LAGESCSEEVKKMAQGALWILEDKASSEDAARSAQISSGVIPLRAFSNMHLQHRLKPNSHRTPDTTRQSSLCRVWRAGVNRTIAANVFRLLIFCRRQSSVVENRVASGRPLRASANATLSAESEVQFNISEKLVKVRYMYVGRKVPGIHSVTVT